MSKRRATAGVGLGLAGLVALGVTIAGAQSDDTPRGTDPLSQSELDAAVAHAQGSDPEGGPESTGLGDDDVVLLVERHQEEKGQEDELRRADIYVYSYDDDVLTRTLVDLETDRVVRSDVLPDTQLPLIPDEMDRVDEITAADTAYQQQLATAYRRSSGQDLTDPATQLDIDPIIFLAESNPAAARTPARVCGDHRCVQLLIQTTDHVVVNLLPIIDLSTGRVIMREGFFR
jgi:hypothetical protein